MAVVISSKQPSLSFPHDILHESQDRSSYPTMEPSASSKPSLPSISSLIKDVDKHVESAKDLSPNLDHQRKLSADSHGHATSPDRRSLVGSPRDPPPPTPPLPGTSSFDFPPRPSTGNTSPGTNGPNHTSYFGNSPGSTNPEHYAQRSSYPPIPESNPWPPGHSPLSPRRPSDEASQHESHRGSTSSYPDPTEATSPYPGLSHQRPLPVNFPPQVPPPGQQLPPIDPQMAPPYQQHHHHHTYPMTNPPAYPQTTDRYVCPTCQKAFSRPSSLKIHTYSHTGEKPFKCKYEGCGKYFSVRSNMKRHEKGCHGGDTSSAGGNSPKS